jgi:hypothetical protein
MVSSFDVHCPIVHTVIYSMVSMYSCYYSMYSN